MKSVKWLRYIARGVLLLFSILIFVFALLSGASGNGIEGVIRNSPNALPWLLLLVFNFVAWKWELIGGIIIVLFSIFAFFAFDMYEEIMSFLIIGLPLLVLGGLFILSWHLHKKR